MTRFKFRKSAIAAAIIFGAAGTAVVPTAFAADQAKPSASTASTAASSTASVPAANQKFAMKAAQGGIAEVELGKLAQEKAQSQEVKSFAARMVKDHSSANDKLKQIASKDGIQLPTEMDKSDQKLHDKLSKLSGAKFDEEYMSHMVSDHKKDVKEFQHEAQSARSDDIKQFASDTLPTLREHLTL